MKKKDDFFNTETGKYYGQVGHKATIERENTTNEKSIKAGKNLREIGAELNFSADHATYMGSMAVHVYVSEVLDQAFFITQTSTLDRCPEPAASTAISDLRNEVLQYYGHNAQRKRSGF